MALNASELRSKKNLSGKRVVAGFHEFTLALPLPVGTVIERLADARILAGVALDEDFPELGNALLVCATETKAEADFDRYAEALGLALR